MGGTIAGQTLVIQGFGNVGAVVAREVRCAAAAWWGSAT